MVKEPEFNKVGKANYRQTYKGQSSGKSEPSGGPGAAREKGVSESV